MRISFSAEQCSFNSTFIQIEFKCGLFRPSLNLHNYFKTLFNSCRKRYSSYSSEAKTIDRLISRSAVNNEPTICNDHLSYPWVDVGGRGEWGVGRER